MNALQTLLRHACLGFAAGGVLGAGCGDALAASPLRLAQADPAVSPPPRGTRVLSRQIPDLKLPTSTQLLELATVGDYDWTPDGRALVAVLDLGGTPNLWRVPVDAPGWPSPLTFVDLDIRAPKVSPDGGYILFEGRLGGDSRADLFVIPAAGGSPVNLTATRNADERDATWSPNGQQIAFSADLEATGTYQVYVLDAVFGRAAGSARRVSRSVQSSLRPRWSPDGKQLLVSRYRTPTDANLVLLRLHAGEELVLTPHKGEQEWRAVDWSPGGNRILTTSNAQGQLHAGMVDVGARKVTWLSQGPSEAVAQDWSPVEDRVAWVVNQAGSFYLHTGLAQEGARGSALRLRRGVFEQAQFSPDGRRLAFKFSSALRAPDLWVYDLEKGVAVQVSFTHDSELASSALVEPYGVSYSTFDGREISGFLYIPHNLAENERRPALIWVHDGPWLQHHNGFHPFVQLLVRDGYVVFAPNYRGSAGGDRDLERLDNLDPGGGALFDLEEAARYLAAVAYVDPTRVGLVGWGFGGYLTLRGLTRSSDVWKVGAAIPGLFDLREMQAQATPLLQSRLLHELGDADERALVWTDRSPRYFLENVSVPTLILDGGVETTYAPEDNGAHVAALRQLGILVEHRVLSRKTTGLAGRKNRLEAYEALVGFLKLYLPVAPAP